VLRNDAISMFLHSQHRYETSDGISRQEEAVVNNLGSDNESIAIKGSYSWTDTDGVVHTINFIADENGFQPQGSDIPA